MDEVARHCRTTIAHYRTVSIDVARCRVTSYGIARSSCDIPHERESQQDFEHDQKLPIHLEIECNVVRLRTIYPRWSAITLKSPIVGGRKTS